MFNYTALLLLTILLGSSFTLIVVKSDLLCPSFNVSDTNNVFQNYSVCAMQACEGETWLFTMISPNSSCYKDPFLRLYSSTGQQLVENDDYNYPYNFCSRLKYTFTNPCATYQLREGCYSSTSCGGQVEVRLLSVVTSAPTYAPTSDPTVSPTSIPTEYPSYIPTNIPSYISCPQGSYSIDEGKSCVACPAGTYSPDIDATSLTTCQACPIGSYSRGGAAQCTLCYPGSYADKPAITSCNLCSINTYNPSTGANSSAACLSCPANSFNLNQVSSSCPLCEANYCPSGIIAAPCNLCI